MNSYLRLIKTVLLHKWYVFIAGRRLKVSLWRLLVHDLSKFSPQEFYDYAQWFYGNKLNHNGFKLAWLHHQHVNDHHWSYWINTDDPHVSEVFPMPWPAVREMVADWFAAGKAYKGTWPDPWNFTWYYENRRNMRLHPDTEQRLDTVLMEAADKWRW